jgi:hypothetical protein
MGQQSWQPQASFGSSISLGDGPARDVSCKFSSAPRLSTQSFFRALRSQTYWLIVSQSGWSLTLLKTQTPDCWDAAAIHNFSSFIDFQPWAESPDIHESGN